MDKLTLRAMREELGLPGRSCAVWAITDRVKVSQSAISQMESGKLPIDKKYAAWLERKIYGRYKRIADMPTRVLAKRIRCREEI